MTFQISIWEFLQSHQTVITSPKPDFVLVNEAEKSVTILELTVPFDSNIDNAIKRKTDKYEDLIDSPK